MAKRFKIACGGHVWSSGGWGKVFSFATLEVQRTSSFVVLCIEFDKMMVSKPRN